MRAKFFFIIIFLLSPFFFLSISESRELSIKQLEERKKADSERLKEREKRGKKKFSKESNVCCTLVEKVENLLKDPHLAEKKLLSKRM